VAGRVGGVLAKPTFQLRYPRLLHGNQAGLLGVGRTQLGDDSLLDKERSSPLAHGPQRHSYTNSHLTINLVAAPRPGPEQLRERLTRIVWTGKQAGRSMS
jgi:hypothetical protein